MPDQNHGWKAAGAALLAAVGLGTAVQQADRAGKAERRAAQESERAAQVTVENEALRAAAAGNWRKPQNGKTYQLSGTQTGAVKWGSVSAVTLLGPATIDAKNKNAYTLFANNCNSLTFRQITFTGGQLGVFLQKGSGFVFDRCKFVGNDQTGFLTNFAANITLKACEAGNSRREHGIYISDGTRDVTLDGLKSTGKVGRMPVQINGSDSGTVRNVQLKNCDLGGGSYGVSLSVYGADGVKATGCTFRDRVGIRTATKCPKNVSAWGCRFLGSVPVEGKDGCSAPVVKP